MYYDPSHTTLPHHYKPNPQFTYLNYSDPLYHTCTMIHLTLLYHITTNQTHNLPILTTPIQTIPYSKQCPALLLPKYNLLLNVLLSHTLSYPFILIRLLYPTYLTSTYASILIPIPTHIQGV